MTDDRLVPYTHWFYFSTKETADAAAAVLAADEYLTVVRDTLTETLSQPPWGLFMGPRRGEAWRFVDRYPTREAAERAIADVPNRRPVEDAVAWVTNLVEDELSEPESRWLLQASKPRLRSRWLVDAAVMERLAANHGGMYDGGESGLLNLRTGEYVFGEGA